MKFDSDAFKSGKMAVHCETEKQAEKFLKYLDEKGFKWVDDDSLTDCTEWYNYKSKTVYCCSDGVSYCGFTYAIKTRYVVKYSDLDFDDEETANRIDCNITANYLTEKSRMIDGCSENGCTYCPLSVNNNDMGITCDNLECNHPDKAIAIVQKWSDEHSEKGEKDSAKDVTSAELEKALGFKIKRIIG